MGSAAIKAAKKTEKHLSAGAIGLVDLTNEEDPLITLQTGKVMARAWAKSLKETAHAA